jgi:hypothetical protein
MNRSETTTRPAGGKSVMLIGAAGRRTFRLPDGIRWEADSAQQAKYTALTRPPTRPLHPEANAMRYAITFTLPDLLCTVRRHLLASSPVRVAQQARA